MTKEKGTHTKKDPGVEGESYDRAQQVDR